MQNKLPSEATCGPETLRREQDAWSGGEIREMRRAGGESYAPGVQRNLENATELAKPPGVKISNPQQGKRGTVSRYLELIIDANDPTRFGVRHWSRRGWVRFSRDTG